MPLVCSSLSKDVVADLQAHIDKLSYSHPLARENKEGIITVTEEAGVTLFQSSTGFYFRQGDALQAIRDEIAGVRNYLCTAFEIDEDPTIPERIRNRFLERVGKNYADPIESILIQREKPVMVVKIPILAMRHMIGDNGGVLKTAFSGNTKILRTIPTLAKYLKFPETDENVSSVFATDYKQGDAETVQAIHNDLVREVMQKPNSGICLKWIARWEV